MLLNFYVYSTVSNIPWIMALPTFFVVFRSLSWEISVLNIKILYVYLLLSVYMAFMIRSILICWEINFIVETAL